MKLELVTILILMLFASAGSLTSFAQSTGQPIVKGGSYSAYFPAVFSITFPQNSQPNVTVHSLANSLFKYIVTTSAPTSTVTVSLNVSDVYQVELALAYPQPISGNISWTLYSPPLCTVQTCNGIAAFNEDTNVSMGWSLTLTQAPQCANLDQCEQQIANASAAILINYDQQKIQALQNGVSQQNSRTNYNVDVLAGLVAFALALLAYDIISKRRIYSKIE